MSQYTFSPAPNKNLSPLQWYQSLQNQSGFVYDLMQSKAIERLDQLYYQLLQFKQKRQRFLGKWLNQPPLPRGLYFYGGVGR